MAPWFAAMGHPAAIQYMAASQPTASMQGPVPSVPAPNVQSQGTVFSPAPNLMCQLPGYGVGPPASNTLLPPPQAVLPTGHQQVPVATVTSGQRGKGPDRHVSSKIKERMGHQHFAFVNMSDMFVGDPRESKLRYVKNDKKEMDSDYVDTKRMPKEDWMEAFSIYGFMLTKLDPQVASELFAHQANVLSIIQSGGDWFTYDLTVRRTIGQGEAQWGDSFISDLLVAQNTKTKDGQLEGERQKNKTDKPFEVPYGFCFNFHSIHSRKKCEDKATCPDGWLHMCFKCKSKDFHRASSCSKGHQHSFRGARAKKQSTRFGK